MVHLLCLLVHLVRPDAAAACTAHWTSPNVALSFSSSAFLLLFLILFCCHSASCEQYPAPARALISAAACACRSLSVQGGLMGLLLYGTVDLTNCALLTGWSWTVALVDMAWGTTACAVLAVVQNKLHTWLAAPGSSAS